MSWAGSPAFRKRCRRSQPKHRSHSPFDLIQPRNFLEPALTGHTRFGFYILRFPNILYLFLTWVPPLSQPFGELADKLRQYPLLILYSILNTAKCAEIPLNGCFKSLFLPFACLPYPCIRRETHRTNRIALWCVHTDQRFARRSLLDCVFLISFISFNLNRLLSGTLQAVQIFIKKPFIHQKTRMFLRGTGKSWWILQLLKKFSNDSWKSYRKEYNG